MPALKPLVAVMAIGVGLIASGASAQEDAVMASNGEYVVADDNGDARVDGGGSDIVYGDIGSGGASGGVYGDPNAIYYPDLSGIPQPGGGVWTPTITGIPVGSATAGNMLDGIDVMVDLTSPTGVTADSAGAPMATDAEGTEVAPGS